MFRGNSATNNQKNPKKRRGMSVAALIALILAAFTIGGTVAFLTAMSNPVQNVFTPAKTDIEIKEDFDQEVKKNVTVLNKSTYPVYVRATYVASWVSDADGSILAEVPTLVGTLGSDWTLNKDDGYYYYNKILGANERTTYFINSLSANAKEGYHLVIDVIAETVQAEPSQAVLEVWGFVPTLTGGE